MRHFIAILLGLSVCGMTTPAFATGIFYPSVFYKNATTDNNGSASGRGDFYGDFRVAYTFESGWLVGGLYSLISGTGDNGYALTQSSLGPLVGFVSGRWLATLSYFVLTTREERSGGNSFKFSDGNGFQLDAAYLVPIANSVQLGPTVAYRQLRYTRRDVNGTGQDWGYDLKDFFPYVGVALLF